MSRSFFYILILFFLVSSCEEQRSKESMECENNLCLRKKFFLNGKVRMEQRLDTNGILQGVSRMYNPDGTIFTEENFRNGLLYGKSIMYDVSSGTVLIKTNFNAGLLHGKRVEYFEATNKPRIVDSFLNGVRTGPQYFYYSNGCLKKYQFYNYYGDLSYQRIYDENGDIVKDSGDVIIMLELDRKIEKEPFYIGDSVFVKMHIAHPPNTRQKIKFIMSDSSNRSLDIVEGLNYNEVKVFSKNMTDAGKYKLNITTILEDTLRNYSTHDTDYIYVRVVEKQ